MRPFAPPRRLPVSGPPLRDHRSRPAPSPYCEVRANPSASTFLIPVAGRSARTRVCCHALRIPNGSSLLRSPSGPFDPSRSSLAAIRRSKAYLRRTPAFRPSLLLRIAPPPQITVPDSLRPARLANSVNLLEPPSSCTETAGPVNKEDRLVTVFSAALLGCGISRLHEPGSGIHVDKSFRSGPGSGSS